VLQQVRTHAVVAPRSATPTLRILAPEAVRLRDGWFARGYEPVLSVRGSPPGFEEPYADQRRLPGRYSTDIEGYRVTDECHHPPVAEGGYTELMLSMEADRGGASVDRMYIDYLADGEARTLRVVWKMNLCGRLTRASCAR